MGRSGARARASDATEYGDLLPLIPGGCRQGDSTCARPDASACLQDITYVAVIRRYPEGVPDELRLKSPPPGYNARIREKFARVVTRDGSEKWSGRYPVNWAIHNAYRGVPDSALPGTYTGREGRRAAQTS